MLTEHGGGIRLHVMIYQRHSRKSTGLAGCWYAGMAAVRLFNTMSTHTLLPPRPTVTLPPPPPQAVSAIFFCLPGLSSNTLRFWRYCLVLYFYPVHPNPVGCLHLSNGSPPSPAFISLNPNSTVCFHFCPNPPDPDTFLTAQKQGRQIRSSRSDFASDRKLHPEQRQMLCSAALQHRTIQFLLSKTCHSLEPVRQQQRPPR